MKIFELLKKLFLKENNQVKKDDKSTQVAIPIKTNDNSNNDNIDISINSEYINKRAKLDSEKEFKLKVIENKQKVLAKLIEIKNEYKKCNKCQDIYQENIKNMKVNLSKLNNYIDDNFGYLNEYEDYKKYMFADNSKIYSSSDDTAAEDLVKFLEAYLKSYTEYKPTYFIACDDHKKINQEHEILETKLKDLNKLIK
ncbi:hypothetical protein [Mycoplasma sp. HU2014]|uniref:hypothetical protein n=1 Tax=Mycoplasma sp. HU2014 TaxID=1664275 RepID=UPI00067CDE0A|nr:hypothetical protein [Mycoplasma sp. HU2014]KNG79253.1 hypothetical protein AB668_03170 [Mycoplasma sp. HU2014]MBY7704805.1 hypothetical protein [Vibrio harveyi]